MKTIITIVATVFISFGAIAEGTKQLTPGNTGKCYVQFNESIGGQRYFAMTTNTDTLHRLYIHIATAGEIINMGFKKLATSVGDARFRIKNPSGTVVYGFTNIPTSGAGYISTFSQADIGPNTLTGGSGGYTPLTYTTTTTGDFYIEFEKTTDPTARYLFEFFDITVSSGTTPKNGRVWSYAWDLNTASFTNSAYAKFYVYSADRYVTAINLNGMQPYSFVIACNNSGVQNTGDLFVDRQSVPNTNTVRPQYKIFLNTPDPAVYPVAEIPTMVENLRINGTPTANQPVEFYINMTKAGTLEIFLDIDGVPGYQSGGRDVVLVEYINAGGDVLYWDGKDGLGDQVTSTISVIVSSKFATGVTHLPVYDAEKNPNGFLVTRVSPDGPTDLVLYWDDSQIPYGTIPSGQVITMLSGNTTANGHKWTTDSNNSDGFGNVHTINTWWNGYEIDNLASFDFILLPIELMEWKAELKGTYVQLNWSTASENNNHLFNVQRSADGITWETISTIVGAGNSTQTMYYTEIDENPLQTIAYYRLQQVDFDGVYSYSPIIAIGASTQPKQKVQVYSVQGNRFISYDNYTSLIEQIDIINSQGKSVLSYVTIQKNSLSNIKIDVTRLPKGMYIFKSPQGASAFYIL
jgi:hypothetical protein